MPQDDMFAEILLVVTKLIELYPLLRTEIKNNPDSANALKTATTPKQTIELLQTIGKKMDDAPTNP